MPLVGADQGTAGQRQADGFQHPRHGPGLPPKRHPALRPVQTAEHIPAFAGRAGSGGSQPVKTSCGLVQRASPWSAGQGIFGQRTVSIGGRSTTMKWTSGRRGARQRSSTISTTDAVPAGTPHTAAGATRPARRRCSARDGRLQTGW
jgi:hypothetical protein